MLDGFERPLAIDRTEDAVYLNWILNEIHDQPDIRAPRSSSGKEDIPAKLTNLAQFPDAGHLTAAEFETKDARPAVELLISECASNWTQR